MAEFSERELERLDEAANLIFSAVDKLPVLKTISWDRSIAEKFFASGMKELPKPEYDSVDPTSAYDDVRLARELIDGTSPVHDWLRRLSDVSEQTAAMLSSVGTKAFYTLSCALYGEPGTPIADGDSSALDLAVRLDQLLSEFDEGALKLEAPARLSAEELKKELTLQLPEYFGADAPSIIVTRDVSAKAAAGKDYIKLRADAFFTDLDITQLLQHEALIHIATGMNGRSNDRFSVLGESHPGNAATQEGLAVFAEFITGSIDPRRFRRLADRAIAIDMSANGADFLEIFEFFRARGERDSPFEAFESARRIVRGGMVEGGAPFTKDGVYLSGLIEVHSYLRTAIRSGDTRLIELLFVGKIDLSDLEAMDMLARANLINRPKILPPWARDPRYLLAYLSYSTFLNQIDLSKVQARYRGLLDSSGMV